MDTLLRSIKDYIAVGEITEALKLIKLLTTTAEEYNIFMHNKIDNLNKECQLLKTLASSDQHIDNVINLSSKQNQLEEAIKELTIHIEEYSSISDQLNHFRNCIPIQLLPSFKDLIIKVAHFKWRLYNWAFFESGFNSLRPFETIHQRHPRGCLTINFVDVRGDGACGFRAFLSEVIYQASHKQVLLPYDPAGIHIYIKELKEIICEFIDIIHAVPANAWFVNDILSVPQNQKRGIATIDEYKIFLMQKDYFMTNYEIRLIAMLFKTQINIIREHTFSTETHQCFPPVDKDIAPVDSDSQYTLIQRRNHFVAAVNVSKGILVPVAFNPDAQLDF
jgi:hypothetical protein